MNDDAMSIKSSLTVPYVDDAAVVFRVFWYIVASEPGVYLAEYSEPESTEFEGAAEFTVRHDDTPLKIGFSVEGKDSNVHLTASGPNKEIVDAYLRKVSMSANASLDKYRVLETIQMGKVRRALVAKTNWDRLVFLILNKRALSEVYYQVAHGREMMIKATEGEELHPITLNTSAWLSQIEKLPREEPLPADIATSLAKKSVEWKQATIEVIRRYI